MTNISALVCGLKHLRMIRTWLSREVMPVMLLGIIAIGTEIVNITICSSIGIFTKFLLAKEEELIFTVTNMPNPSY